jgi:DHA1 family bicyclomycin/chloramphenicol resistance-like MFS transporter
MEALPKRERLRAIGHSIRKNQVMTSNFLRTAVILGLLSAIGPFAIDMYLPALPTIGQDLGAGTVAVQMSLLVFFLSMGFGQIVVGPISDMVGRKAPLYFGLALFVAGSIGSALAPDIGWLIAFRFIQGFGACAGMVVPRAVVRDLHTGTEAARLMSLLMLVFSISPILAPLTGSFIIEGFGWRAVFWAVTIAALIAVVLLAFGLKETRPAGHRVGSSFGSALAGYKFLMGDRNFLGLTFIGGFGISSFFVYLANSSFVIIDHYGMSPSQYSLFFSVNAVSFFSVSQMSGWLTEKYGLKRTIRFAVYSFAAVMIAMWAIMATGFESLALMTVALFIGYGMLGLVIPTTSVLAMEEHGAIAGTASALMGTLHMITGVAAMSVSGFFANGLPLPMMTGIAACAAIALLLTMVTLKPGEEVESAVAFYIDPALARDPNVAGLSGITLSYTYFPSRNGEPVATSSAAAAAPKL